MFEEIFLRKKLIPERLIQYGFKEENDLYSFTTEIFNKSFILTVTFNKQGDIDTFLIEKDTGEEYILYKTSAQGTFVGEIRKEIGIVLSDIADTCFESSIFKQEQTLQLIEHVSSVYGDELEFLWKKFSDNGIWRRKDTGKWYGAILTVAKSKLGLASNKTVEIIDLRISPDKINDLLKQEGFYPGWHMNKKSWFTVILDGSVKTEILYRLIKDSYALATK